MKRLYLDLLLASGCVVSLVGITDYWKMDLLGFKADLSSQQLDIFVSFIGNINTYTALVEMLLAAAATLLCYADNKKQIAGYYICTVIAMFATITGRSDNSYLSFAAVFTFLPLYLFKTRRYCVILATFAANLWAAWYVTDIYSKQVIGLEGTITLTLCETGLVPAVTVLLWILAAVLYLHDYKTGKKDQEANAWCRKGWLLFLLTAVLCIAVVLCDVNLAGNAGRYGSLQKLLLFDDDWGTHRGYPGSTIIMKW